MTIRPLSPALGVEVDHLDPRDGLSANTCEALRDLLWRYQLILISGVELTVDEHRRLLAVFGAVEDEQGDGKYHSFVTEGEELIYHCDYGFMPEPLPVVSLYGVEVPDSCAPTLFASGVHACRRLPASLRARLEGRHVLHASDVRSATQRSAGPLRPEDLERVPYRGTSHPAILTHPRSGEEILFFDEYLSVRIEGISLQESASLLSDVHSHLYAPAHVYEHHWRSRDLIVFDNLALSHKRAKGEPRVLRRLITGAVPRSADA
jgi:alpha-ketoglutarate-dependent taurine dioxygenase